MFAELAKTVLSALVLSHMVAAVACGPAQSVQTARWPTCQARAAEPSAKAMGRRLSQLWGEATAHYYYGEYERARSLFDVARAARPDLPGSLRYLALIAHSQSQWGACIGLTDQFLCVQPDSPRAPMLRAIRRECAAGLGGKAPRRSHAIRCPPETRRRVENSAGREVWCETEDGKRHGPVRSYYPNGSAELTGMYHQGTKHGHWQYWHKSGRRSHRGRYAYGDRLGVWETFHTNERLASRIKWFGRNKLSEELWHDNGHRAEQHVGQYLHGGFRRWHRNGSLATQGRRLLGFPHGRWVHWDEHGMPMRAEYFHQGRLLRTVNLRRP